jgi:small-conductance mechanosensitive channel
MNQQEIFQLSIYIISGIIAGLVLYKIVMPAIAKLAARTSIKSDDLIIASIRKWVIPWCFALGLFLGLKNMEFESRYYYWLENGLLIFYIVSATLILAKVVAGMIRIKAAGTDAVIPSSSIISNITIIIIYCIGLLIILQSQGISITPVLTALGVGGLAVALALQPTLSNLFAGLQLISSGNFNRGDFIKLTTGEDGFIEDITWRSTTIRAASDHIIIVPNSKLADMTVSNYYLPQKEITFSVELGISYDSNLDEVERITKEVIKDTLEQSAEGAKDFEPETRFSAFADGNIRLRAFLRVNSYPAQFEVRSEFIKKLHSRFYKEGILIPYPTRTVYMNDKKQ